MEAEERQSPEKPPEQEYFEFLATMGVTKHLGSLQATRELVELCHIGEGSYVLDVGCGVGATPAYLARKYDCRVVGVDLLEGMIEQSRARARADKLEDRLEFRVADARELPFDDDTFDVVITESVNVFFEDKQQALSEYKRVTRPGGYVGLIEMTWLREPPPEVVDYYKRMVYADALDAEGWKALLVEAGLQDVVGNGYKVDIPTESRGRFERYGCRGILKALGRTVVVMFTDPGSRGFLKDVCSSLPQDMLEDMGYGVYAGRKA